MERGTYANILALVFNGKECCVFLLQLEVAAVVRDNFVAIVVDVGEQVFVQFFPAGTLQDFSQLFLTLNCAQGQHLRPFPVHGIQDFTWLDTKLHQARRKFTNDELGEILFTPHFDVPLHQQSNHELPEPFLLPRVGKLPIPAHPSMAQYQKGHRNATLQRFSSWQVICLGLALFVVSVSLGPGAVGALAAPVTQAFPAELLLPVLTPVTSNGISLHTHTVDLALTPGDGLALNVALRAVYRMRNDGKETTSITLQLPSGAVGATLTADEVPLALAAGADGTSTVTVPVAPDVPVELVLVYATTIQDRRLPLIRYPSANLDQWLGQVSMRMDIRPAANMPPSSWLRAEPSDWAYAPPGVSPDPALEWLYDGDPPDAILFEAIHPSVWEQIQAAEQATAPGAAPGAFAQLGEVYGQLAGAAGAEGSVQAAERFYSQSVAAYTNGIRQAEAAGNSAADQAEAAGLHAGLAGLYRGRVVGPDGASNAVYAELMTAEASTALQGLPAGDPRRPELERWQAEGLRLLLTDARRRGDVGVALTLIDRLTNSRTGAGAADFLAAERQALIVQQALELLERGDRSAALALAGDAISDPALQPAEDMISLFSSWAASAAMSEAGITLDIDAFAQPDRIDAARAALQQIVEGWQKGQATRGISVSLEDKASQDESAPLLHLRLQLPAGTTGVALAEALPGSANWALLRSLLGQLGPKLDSSTDGLRQQVHVSQPVDLRTAGQQWAMMAQKLAGDADSFEAQASSTAQGEAATMDASLKARIRAANFRHAAEAWRSLGRDSFVELSLAATGSLGNSTRTWLVTVDSPPQMLDVQVDSLSTGRTVIAAAGLGLLLLVVAGLLWRLLA